jgi:hypothetical protein
MSWPGARAEATWAIRAASNTSIGSLTYDRP